MWRYHLLPFTIVALCGSASPFELPYSLGPTVRDLARTATASIIAPLVFSSLPLTSEPVHAAAPLVSHHSDPSLPTTTVVLPSQSPKEYLPRRLYPGTYKNYCGPTPETQVRGGCIAHGWYGDAPADQVDAACEVHDVAYCQCETDLLSRRAVVGPSPPQPRETNHNEEEIPLLSSMVALRFVTKPALERTVHADAQYFDCVNKADRQLIATGIRIRGEQQRSGCSTDPNLSWFCDSNGRGTLAAFEKVNLNIFLRDLDADEAPPPQPFMDRRRAETKDNSGRETLAQLERRREDDLRTGLQKGRAVADAASSEAVLSDEEKILRKLAADDVK